jgi:KaiC/GvpD/RAD55 family RecA-like ATPase
MRPKTALLLLVIALAMLQSGLHAASGDPLTTEVTLYAHTDPSAGRILTLNSNSTTRQAADAREGVAFTLVPPLSAPLRIRGEISIYVWLSSQTNVRGTLRVALSEVMANASVVEIAESNLTLAVSSIPYPPSPYPPPTVIFGLAGIDHTLVTNSTLRLEVQFSPVSAVPVSLLWDDPSTRTRVALKVESTPKTSLTIMDSSGEVSSIFAQNGTGMAQLMTKVSVEDAFGGTNVRAVSIKVTNSTGYTLVNSPMNMTSSTTRPLRLEYIRPITIPAGDFNVTASVQDYAHRLFVATKKITVTRFCTLSLSLTDPQARPLPGVNVSLSAASVKWIKEATTDSNGTTVSLVPSGPITVQVWKSAVRVLSQEFEVSSDTKLQLVLGLYDWTFHVTLRNLNVPISAARVELHLNGTLVNSNSTDANGLAIFKSMPPGTYDVTVASPTWFATNAQLDNVTFLKSEKTEISLSVYYQGWSWLLLMAAPIAVVAFFGALVVARRRPGKRGFKHVADLFGGALPSSSVVMIAGPSGSGRSLLLQNILGDSLQLRRHCVYVSNSEMPSRIKGQLARMGLDSERYENDNMLRFIDAYSGGSGVVSSEKHSVSSPRDLTGLGIQITSCLDEVGGVGDVFLDSLAPIAALGDSTKALNFVEYYGARIVKSGGSFLYVASDTIESDLLRRFEDSSDCVFQTERYAGPGKVRNRLLVKKARGIEHEPGWVGLKIAPSGRMEFIALPAEHA